MKAKVKVKVKVEEGVRHSLSLPNVSQVGFVVKNLDNAVQYYEETFGFGPFDEPKIIIRNKLYYGKTVSATWRMSFCSLGPLELEIVEPLIGPSIFHDFLRVKGDGIHHFGFDVPDMDKILRQCPQLGIEIIQLCRTSSGGFAWLNSERMGGVVFEIIQRKQRS